MTHYSAMARNWTWLHIWNTTPEQDQRRQAVEALLRCNHRNSPPLVGYAIFNGWRWLAGAQVDLQEQAPHCTEQVKSVPNHIMQWLLSELCANTTFSNISKIW